MRGVLSILSLFRSKFNQPNNTEARVLNFIYHRTFANLILVKMSLSSND